MVELWIIIVVLCLLTATGSALIALRLQYRSLDNTRQEREAWQQPQEGRQRTWEVRQGKHILDAEKKLADQLKDARREWREWSVQVQQDHQEWRDSVDLATELDRLPHIEDLELTQRGHLSPKNWQPSVFYKANLSGRDLSYRYLERADLRDAELIETNLYMANLTGASLTGANLQRADLTGANLSGADLRGADFSHTNLLVADLHNAVLHGTNLAGARNLTTEQLQTAIYDSTTIIDSSIDITLPRIPGVVITPPALLTAASSGNQQAREATDTPDEGETQTAIVAANPLASNTELADSASAASGDTEKNDTAPLTESSAPLSTAPDESQTAAPVAEVSVTSPQENKTAAPQGETSKKNSRKRSGKPKRTTASLPPLPDTPEEAGMEKDEEELLPNKIIQLQTRTAKTRSSTGSGDGNKDDQVQNQRVHAN